MASSEHTFDIISRVDFQEVENALGQARKEIATRYDFKNTHVEIVRDKEKITVVADDEFRMRATIEVLEGKFVKRGVPLKNIEYAKQEAALGGMVRQLMTIRSGIPVEKAKEIVRNIKDSKIKVQPSIQVDQIRVAGKSRDDLQRVIQGLRNQDFAIDLQFTNYR